MGVTHDREVGSTTRRGEMCQRSTLTHAVDDVSRHNTSPEGSRRIVVFDGIKPSRRARLEESAMLGKKRARWVASDRNGTVAAVPAIVEIRITFDATEKGKHIGKGP